MYKELLAKIGERLDANDKVISEQLPKLNEQLLEIKSILTQAGLVRISVIPENSPEPQQPGIYPPESETPEFSTSNPAVDSIVRFATVVIGSERLPLYLVTFDDGFSRIYTMDTEGVKKNRGSNILYKSDTIIEILPHKLLKSLIDSETGNGGEDSSPYAATV